MSVPAPAIPWYLRCIYALPNALYGRGLGWLLGHRFLQLTHRGRRSGHSFQTVLEVVRYDGATGEATVVAGYGRGSDWLRNVRAGGPVAVNLGHGPRPAAFRSLSVEEATEVFAAYERRNVLIRPVVRWVLSALLGWRYDGTSEARRRMAEQLPMVAFRPLSRQPASGEKGTVSPGGHRRRR